MKKIGSGLGKALKAVYAGVSATLTGVGVALIGAHTFGQITAGQWIAVAGFGLGSLAAVYGVTNSSPAPPAGLSTTTIPPKA